MKSAIYSVAQRHFHSGFHPCSESASSHLCWDSNICLKYLSYFYTHQFIMVSNIMWLRGVLSNKHDRKICHLFHTLD